MAYACYCLIAYCLHERQILWPEVISRGDGITLFVPEADCTRELEFISRILAHQWHEHRIFKLLLSHVHAYTVLDRMHASLPSLLLLLFWSSFPLPALFSPSMPSSISLDRNHKFSDHSASFVATNGIKAPSCNMLHQDIKNLMFYCIRHSCGQSAFRRLWSVHSAYSAPCVA